MCAMMIDIEKIRTDMEQDCLGAYFGGGFGGALMEMTEIEQASEEEVLEMAKRKGVLSPETGMGTRCADCVRIQEKTVANPAHLW